MRLYTSLVRAKEALGLGRLPPMTPIPTELRDVINPEFTPGMGSLYEDEQRGLMCPVCGSWCQNLGVHTNNSHADIGGADGIRKMLSIPKGTGLTSQKLHIKLRQHRPIGNAKKLRKRATDRTRQKGRDALRDTYRTVNAANLRGLCEAQVQELLVRVADRLGRSPSKRDAIAALGPSKVRAIVRLYGTWNAAKTMCGLDIRRNEWSFDDVVRHLAAYVEIHGRLPTREEAHWQKALPLIPRDDAILRACEATRWRDAMCRVTDALAANAEVAA